jgi:hypothetical protein
LGNYGLVIDFLLYLLHTSVNKDSFQIVFRGKENAISFGHFPCVTYAKNWPDFPAAL